MAVPHTLRSLVHALVVFAAVGCAGAPMPPLGTGPDADFVLDPAAQLEAVARPEGLDWSYNRLSHPKVDALRRENPRPRAAGERALMAMPQVYAASATAFGGSASSGRVTTAPAYIWRGKQALWLTDTGWLLRYDMTNGTTSTVRVSNADTFAGTAITLSADSKRAYFCSAQGNFYVIDVSAATMAHLAGSPYVLGGANANAPNIPAPWIDVLAGRPDGQLESVYALGNNGKLHRFYVSAPAGGTLSITKPTPYQLPVATAGSYTEIFTASPIVIRGKAYIGTYRRHATNSTLHLGNLYVYDTGCAKATASDTAGANQLTVALSGPVWAAPAIEFDDTLTGKLCFVPTGYTVTMIDLTTGDKGESAPLIVNQTVPVSGSLLNYPYGTTGVSNLDKSWTSMITIADATTLNIPTSGTWFDKDRFFATFCYDGSVSTPIWAYAKFAIAQADLVVGGTERAIIDAKVELRCNSSSNSNGNLNPAPDPLRAFVVNNNLSTGAAWTDANMTPANRPPFTDNAAFSHANLNGHSASELGNAGNSFQNGQRYTWSAKGLVSTVGTYSFGYAHPELPYVNSAPNNGQPFKTSAPRFDGSDKVVLRITRSGEGFSTPTMSNAVTIDSTNRRIYVLNTNCLYSVSYESPTYEAATPWDVTAFGERKAYFNSPASTYFHLTRLGQDLDSPGSAGPLSTVPSKQYVANVAAPLYDGSKIWVMDNHPAYNRTAITKFTPGTPPVQADFSLLADTGGEVKKPSSYLTYDWDGSKVIFGTFDSTAASTKGRVHVYTR